MKKFILILMLFQSHFCDAQQSLKTIRKSSWQTIIYKISATDAENFIKWDSISIQSLENQIPVYQGNPFDTDSLPIGNYVKLDIVENQVVADLINKTNLMALTINNGNRLQIDVRSKSGILGNKAQAFIGKKPLKFNESSKTFWIKASQLDEKIIKICSENDTSFIQLNKNENYSRSIFQQRKANFKQTQSFALLNFLPRKIKVLLRPGYHYRNTSIRAKGYIIFNQPKYKPLDTVKFKGYVVDKKLKQYRKPINVFTNYYFNNKNVEKLLFTLAPVSDGAYTSQFVLADSIPIDINCNLVFKTLSGKSILNNNFKIEDYLLDDMGSFNFKADKETYYRGDSLHFFAGSKDANGLNIMDGTATLILTTGSINNFYTNKLFVPDTLFIEEKPLSTTGDTKFSLSSLHLPAADLSINATLVFKNSNNEIHEKKENIDYIFQANKILVAQQNDSLTAVFLQNGIEVPAEGTFDINDGREEIIKFPFRIKIDPIAKNYNFYIADKIPKKSITESFEITENYRPDFRQLSQGDTLGFALNNPYKIPIYFTVFQGNKIIATGKNAEAIIKWQMKVHTPRKAFKVSWQWVWAGKERKQNQNIGLLYKMLDVKINASENVFPGQQDSIKIEVKDYKGLPAANVNLTAVSYNNQFSNFIRFPQPPYLARYKQRPFLTHDNYEINEDFILTKKYALGKNQFWIEKFHLDTMLFYKLLFPKNNYFDAVSLTKEILPQVSVNVVKNGIPQEIYLLYINRQLVYYNGTTEKANYAFQTMPENVQIGIRLFDKFIEIDSLYLQPNYKHDLSIDMNNLPAHSRINIADNFWSNSEMNLIESTMLLMKNDYYNNNAFIWQNNNVFKLENNRQHIVGPFNNNKLTFFKPGYFDINFNFESGYEFSLSDHIVRLERKNIFWNRTNKNYLPQNLATSLKLGDTIAAPPIISYPPPAIEKKLVLSKYIYDYQSYAANKPGNGMLQLEHIKDTTLKYFVLEPKSENSNNIVLRYNNDQIHNIKPGLYNFYAITNNFFVAQFNDIEILKNGTFCLKSEAVPFNPDNSFINALLMEALKPIEQINTSTNNLETAKTVINSNEIFDIKNGGVLKGKIIDAKGGNPIPFATITIKGSSTGTTTNDQGEFTISKLRSGKITFNVLAVGYTSKICTTMINDNLITTINISLLVSRQELNEVVVIGYGTAKKMSLSRSVVTISGQNLFDDKISLSWQLSGRVAGLNISANNELARDPFNLILRGSRSMDNAEEPLYVVDGIIYSGKISDLNPNLISNISVLKGSEATALYGVAAAKGVILITTKTKTFRQSFRDYAFWQPNFFTDKNGKASFEVTYPDNITGWKTFVMAMDKKRRVGRASILTQSYKPITAQLSTPQFLIEGDSSLIIGKAFNYTGDNYQIASNFKLDGIAKNSIKQQLLANQSQINEQRFVAKEDTVIAQFSVATTTGFRDAEERKIPVFKKGTEEAVGQFWVLQQDTTVNFSTLPNTNGFEIYAQNNTLDLLLNEIEHLKQYPYYCIEQTASKLLGYSMEQRIKAQLNQKFKNEKEMNQLLQKIQKAQLMDGSWPWWQNGKSNFYITNYVAQALEKFKENELVQTNIRNAFLFLQNQLPALHKKELLAALVTLSNGNHTMNYEEWLQKIVFDSLSQHQQWQFVQICQQQKLNYETTLKSIVNKKIENQLGGIHWGEENYSWYSNEIATTVIAFNILEKEAAYHSLLPQIVQYFLEKRRSGYWTNTVESATIVSAILPFLLEQNKNFTAPSILKCSGDSNFIIADFPYHMKNTSLKNISFDKTGGGMVYLTAYQKIFNTAPNPVEDKFIVTTYFEKNGTQVQSIKSGEKIKMVVKINVLKDADYIMLQVPIPAGCSYTTKDNNDWQTTKEFYKDKMILFSEKLDKGLHLFEIELDARYMGTYHLNPAKIELMYFPIFYGRNEIKKVEIN